MLTPEEQALFDSHLLRKSDAQPSSAPPAAPRIDEGERQVFDSYLDARVPRPSAGISVGFGLATSSEEYARAVMLSRKSGLPLPYVLKNPKVAEDDVRAAQLRELAARDPFFAEKLSNPEFVALAKDDIEAYRKVREGASALKPAPASASFRDPTGQDVPLPMRLMALALPQTWALATLTAEDSVGAELMNAFRMGYHGDLSAAARYIADRAAGATPVEMAIRQSEIARKAEKFRPSEETARGLAEISAADGAAESALAIARNPRAVGYTIARSMGAYAPTLLGLIALSGAGIPLGVVSGFTVGTALVSGTSSFVLEYGSILNDEVAKRGVDPKDTARVAEMLASPEFMSQVHERGVKRGIPIAVMDALTGGFAGKFLSVPGKTLAKNAARASAELAMQAGGGMAGETLAQIAEGRKNLGWGDIFMEGLAEIATGGGEFVANTQALQAAAHFQALTIEANKANSALVAAAGLQMQQAELANISALKDNPSGVAEFINHSLSYDGAPDAVYVPASLFQTALQAAGIPVETLPRNLASSLQEAEMLGTEVRIPIGDYSVFAARYPEVGKLLNENVRVGLEGMTAKEASEWLTMQSAEMEQEMRLVLQASADGRRLEQERNAIRERVVSMFAEANLFPDAAKHYGNLTASVFTTLAAKIGESPLALFEDYRLGVEKEMYTQATAEALAQPEFDNTQLPAAIEAFSAEVAQKHGLQEFKLTANVERGEINLDSIVVPEASRGQGFGTAAMRDLIAFADKESLRITLTPANVTGQGATASKRLADWYTKLGFVPNTGENHIPGLGRPKMYREPQDRVAFLSQGTLTPMKRLAKDKNGRYIGAPQWVGNNPRKLAALKRILKNLALEGEPARFWYEESSRMALWLANGDKDEAVKIAAVLAAYSPNANIASNTSMALNAYMQYKLGLPIDAGFSKTDERVGKYLYDGTLWDGLKTNAFFFNLLEVIDPQMNSSDYATLDVWMAVAFGYHDGKFDTRTRYQFGVDVMAQIGRELGWEPHQVQAAVWAAARSRGEKYRAQIDAQARSLGYITEADGKERKSSDYYMLAHSTIVTSPFDPKAELDTTNFADLLQERLAQISWEATPSKNSGVLPGLLKASLKDQIAYRNDVIRALSDEKGRDLIAQIAGLPQGGQVLGYSARESDTGAGAQTFMPVQRFKREGEAARTYTDALPKGMKDRIVLYCAIRGYLLHQDVVAWHFPLLTAPKSNASIEHKNFFQIFTKRPLTKPEMEFLYARMHTRFNTWDIAPGYIMTGARIGNFTSIPNPDFQQGMLEVVRSLPSGFGGGIVADKTHGYRSEADSEFRGAISNDWTKDRAGEGYRSVIEKYGGPDVLAAVERLRSRVEAVNDRYESRFGGGFATQVAYAEGRARGTPSLEEFPPVGVERPDGVTAYGVHFSAERRPVLSSAMHGTGSLGPERARLADADPALRKRLYFYVSTGAPIVPERGVGDYAHGAKLIGLYDAGRDPLGLALRYPEANAFEKAVMDGGFAGYYVPHRGVAVLLGDHEFVPVFLGGVEEANAAVEDTVPESRGAMTEGRSLVHEMRGLKPRLPTGMMAPEEWYARAMELNPRLADRLKTANVFNGTEPVAWDELERLAFVAANAEDAVATLSQTPPAVIDIARAVEARFGPLTTDWRANKVRGILVSPALDGQPGFLVTNGDRDAIMTALKETLIPASEELGVPIFLSKAVPIGMREAFSMGFVWSAVGHDTPAGVPGYPPFYVRRPRNKLAQEGGRELGRLVFDPTNLRSMPVTIKLLDGANLSTFLHELGHFYLEILTDLVRHGKHPAASADLASILAWLGVDGVPEHWAAMPLAERRPYHEKFARGFEAYLMQGEAPAIELQNSFARFRDWLVDVYRSEVALDVKVDDEVRALFDRMVATDEQIEAVKAKGMFGPLFTSMQEAGFTADQWEDYQGLAHAADEEAKRTLDAASVRALAWVGRLRDKTMRALAKDAERKRRLVEAEVRQELMAEPVYAAMHFLKTGEINGVKADGEHQLSLAALKEMYGDHPAAPWRYLPTGSRAMVTAKGGVHPDLVAEMFGIRSGDALVRKILSADPFQKVLEELTEARMFQRYGDIQSKEAIRELAEEAIHNEARARMVAVELRALEKSTGESSAMSAFAKRIAESVVSETPIEALDAEKYLLAERRAAKRAFTAFRNPKAQNLLGKDLPAGQEWLAAAVEKRNQLLNGHAYRAALDAEREIEKALRYLKRVEAMKTLDPAGQAQIHKLMERFGLRAPEDRYGKKPLPTLKEWKDAVEHETGYSVTVDEALLDEHRAMPYRKLKVGEFRLLVETVKSIEHVSREQRRMLLLAKAQEFDSFVEQTVDTIKRNARGHRVTPPPSRTGATDILKDVARLYLAEHRKLASLIYEMDGFDRGGFLWYHIIRIMNERADWEVKMRAEAAKRLKAIFDPVKGLTDKVRVDEINDTLTREEIIVIALNTGNVTNLERLMTGNNWSREQVQAVLNHLRPEDAKAVQEIWDFLESYRPLIAEKELRVSGVEPTWVKPIPVETPHGILRGGYYPILYDPFRTAYIGASLEAKVHDQIVQGFFARTSTDRGHLQERTESTGFPLRFDLQALNGRISAVIHDLAWHEFLVDMNRLIGNEKFRDAVRTGFGDEVYKQFKEIVRDIAIGDLPALSGAERVVRHLRVGSTITALGFNFVTTGLQVLGASQSIVRVGPFWFARGLGRFLGDAARMESTAAWVRSKSVFMENRARTQWRESSEVLDKVVHGESVLEAIERMSFVPMQTLQLAVDIPTWLAAYYKALAANPDEARAIALADQTVRDTQGSGLTPDLSGVQRGSEFKRLWTNLYSFFNVTQNLSAESARRVRLRNPLTWVRFMSDALLIWVIPSVFATLVREALKGDFPDEDELRRKIIADQVAYLTGQYVLIRELGSVGLGYYGYEGPVGTRFVSDVVKLGVQMKQEPFEVDRAMVKAGVNVASGIFHLPGVQMNRIIDSVWAYNEGEEVTILSPIGGVQRK